MVAVVADQKEVRVREYLVEVVLLLQIELVDVVDDDNLLGDVWMRQRQRLLENRHAFEDLSPRLLVAIDVEIRMVELLRHNPNAGGHHS